MLPTTSLGEGYPLLDDPEGWGHLNLYTTSDGYGRFDVHVTVAIDGARDGFAIVDAWNSPIAGPGDPRLTGTGRLGLTGANTYAGGTTVAGGGLGG